MPNYRRLIFPAGTRVKVIANNSHHGFPMGEVVEVMRLHPDVLRYLCRNSEGEQWYLADDDVIAYGGD